MRFSEKGADRRRGERGGEEERKAERKEEEGGAKLDEQCPQWMRHVAVWWQ